MAAERHVPHGSDLDRTAELVRRLATDDAFRRRVETDPTAALSELGLEAPDRRGPVRLPSKAVLQATMATLLVAGAPFLACTKWRYWTF